MPPIKTTKPRKLEATRRKLEAAPLEAAKPVPAKGNSDWSYGWIPVVAPIVGGIIGAGAYFLIGF